MTAIRRLWTRDVGPEALTACTALDVGTESRPDRHSAPNAVVEVGLRSSPVRLGEPVGAVPWDRHCGDPRA